MSILNILKIILIRNGTVNEYIPSLAHSEYFKFLFNIEYNGNYINKYIHKSNNSKLLFLYINDIIIL